MKLKKIAKLQIARETLRNLDETSLGAAAGGSMTSGTVYGGQCCLGCGCVNTQVPEVCGSFAASDRDSCLCPLING